VRDLHLRISVGAAEHQQPLCCAYHHSDFSDSAQNLRRAHRSLVGLDLGTESLRLVLVDSLDLGYDPYSPRSQPHRPGRTRTGRLAGLARLDNFRSVMGHRRASQSLDADVPALLRSLGLVEEEPARTAV